MSMINPFANVIPDERNKLGLVNLFSMADILYLGRGGKNIFICVYEKEKKKKQVK